MISELKKIESSGELIELLNTPSIWETLDIDYHPPRVERVWTQLDDMRLSLHIIHPCKEGESLWHPHPWEGTFHVLNGVYEHGIGVGNNEISNIKELMKQEVHGEMYYEMLDKDSWHYVRPIGEALMTVMLSGPVKWEENRLTSPDLKPLTKTRKLKIIHQFKEHYEHTYCTRP